MAALSGSPIVGLAQRAPGRTDADIERTREAIRKEVPAKVARVVASMLAADCACRKRLVSILFNDYAGLAYAGWLCVVVLLLADILGNRARVCNSLLQTAGAAVPC